ncbi:hypothetical protein CYMTET_51452 [Cymbomonas tetramitiformis]|uniref:Uncharacterized protein n=1 Tax=Cymbomonas tetramitiformis TaxID=36881 RepID=A0AAE0BMI5_9CHLO|nr:hypothetical protein CYMTET_51452 [Cymbomonas tetramitiformis]
MAKTRGEGLLGTKTRVRGAAAQDKEAAPAQDKEEGGRYCTRQEEGRAGTRHYEAPPAQDKRRHEARRHKTRGGRRAGIVQEEGGAPAKTRGGRRAGTRQEEGAPAQDKRRAARRHKTRGGRAGTRQKRRTRRHKTRGGRRAGTR